ncbi:(Fe-S)-binding protein [Arenimonas composti]|uniref:Glycolate oxidase iron-sulfur subunit n=1 Tax=Arenimonas composti TR7-09 = DSM 18010 TaxID=1121013 RepID=A0A091BKN1_9GAMM|nr:(Fe-S)-binding protein [Arenimonas composti]KFN51354.1 hypothetical protein P873_03555 [Arenimonas composti TR7-09 = DSM 18010]
MSVAPEQAARAAPEPSPPGADPRIAPLLALADRCVQCGLCLPHCPTYRLDRIEAESPRGRIAWARATAAGRLAPTEAGDVHLDHCLGCRRCEPVCPAGVKYGELLVQARTVQAQRRPPAPRVQRLLALLRRPRRLAALLRLYRFAWPLLPARWRPLPRPPASFPSSSASSGYVPVSTGYVPVGSPALAIFVGCIARSYEGPARAALVALLRAAGVEPRLPDGQGCCGAADAHAGLADPAAVSAATNRQAFAGAGDVLCLASGCHDSLARSLDGVATVSEPLAWLASRGEGLRFRAANRRVALHLPCTQRSVLGGGEPIRALLARIPGLELVLLPDTGCCGAAGLHQMTEPARAAAFRAPLLEAFTASGASELLSTNIGCRLHLGTGTTLPVRHPIEFLAEHLA